MLGHGEMNGHRPTIRDVAERAGVSKSLVSLVMRGEPMVRGDKRLRVQQAAEELGYRMNLAACSFGRAFSRASNTRRTLVTNQMNLSWEYAAANPVTASERMNVFFSNGDVAFLDSSLCNKPIASSGGTWLRSDFTGFKTGCSFSVVGDTAGTYAADGTHSAWAVYAALFPEQVVTIRYLLVDSGAAPATGHSTYYFDRISLGAGKMYTRSAGRAVNCPTESVC